MRAAGILIVLTLLLGACGGGTQVGSEELLEFEEETPSRIGQIEQPSPSPSPSPEKQEQDQQQQQQQEEQKPQGPDIVITLVRDHPYYEPPLVTIRVGSILRVINQDTIDRTYESVEDGGPLSPVIKPGESWDWEAKVPGTYTIRSKGIPYATCSQCLKVVA